MKHNQTENIEKIFTEICKDLEFQTFNIFKNFWYSFIDKNKPKISLKIKDPTRSQDIYKDFSNISENCYSVDNLQSCK